MKKIIFYLPYLILTSFLISCNETSIVEPGNTKTEYNIKRAGSDGNNWEEIIKLPENKDSGKIAIRSQDIIVDSLNNIYLVTTLDGIKIVNLLDASYKTIYYNNTSSDSSHFSAILNYNGKIITAIGNYFTGITGTCIYNVSENAFKSINIFKNPTIITSLSQALNGDIYAGCYKKILVSTDGGNSWSEKTQGIEGSFGYFYSFAFDKYNNVYGATRNGIYFSNTNKNNFHNIGLSNETILSIALNSKDWIFATTEDGYLYYSKDSGKNWIKLQNYPRIQSQTLYINDKDYLIVGTQDGVYRSTDNGNSWESMGLKNKFIIKIIPDLKGNLIAATYMNEVYISRNN